MTLYEQWVQGENDRLILAIFKDDETKDSRWRAAAAETLVELTKSQAALRKKFRKGAKYEGRRTPGIKR